MVAVVVVVVGHDDDDDTGYPAIHVATGDDVANDDDDVVADDIVVDVATYVVANFENAIVVALRDHDHARRSDHLKRESLLQVRNDLPTPPHAVPAAAAAANETTGMSGRPRK